MASTALAIAGLASAAAGIGSAVIGSDASTTAANEQVSEQNKALQVQQQEFNTTQQNEAPWLQAGQVSLQQLMSGLQPGGQFTQTFPGGQFNAPTLGEAEQTPGYKFAQQEGEQGIEQGASASGGSFTSGELENLAQFNNSLAQNAYQQTYNNALNTYNTQFNAYNTNQANLYNKLASTSGLGQTTATQLGQLGQQSATNTGNTLTNIGSAQAAGTVGSANAYNSGLGLIANGITGPLTLSALMTNNPALSGGGGTPSATPIVTNTQGGLTNPSDLSQQFPDLPTTYAL